MSNAFYITLFKPEGHLKWRIYLDREEDGFDKEIVAKTTTVVAEKKVLRVDRFTAEIEMK